MKKLHIVFISAILMVLALSGCSSKGKTGTSSAQSSSKKADVTVSAAASLQNALTDMKPSFEKKYPDAKLTFNFGASGALQQQISQGAPADIFFSAAQDKFDLLVKQGLIKKGEGKAIVGNDLVLVVPKGSTNIHSFNDLAKAGKIALGTPESVPAGQYGKEVLTHDHVWKQLQGKIVYGKDVRQVLTYVETGNVDAGIVYKTDALTSKKVEIAATAPDSSHDPIIYPAGVIKNSSHLKQAKEFYQYLQSGEAMKILEKYGFKEVQ
ncbi:molybdate ABC transporter substrate-binding protein [Heyndrickxia acidicola]|uniref:Molybdate ABC transporter substrate-binding protein n=1 Tax=Heyndrickxia acidicola TaxID=209389 RepID=A0ABU6MGD8_9BACI|nr:molybdate ABC transporter substrate-binding protein [Heyndrickxia acidicola]MED1203749.1 molybdate ABC transporter substrate-binding protein [Heyndrickxia acidicola]